MKKIIFTLTLLCVLTAGAFGQMLLDARTYLSCFSLRENDIADSDFVWEASDEELVRFGGLAGDIFVETPLEFALLSYYSSAVRNIRPAQANTILPANNPRLADQKLGAAVFQEIQILRFLGDTAAVNRHEAVLQFITGRGNATRAEIEAFYRNNIRGLISQVVDEEFNKVSFLLDKSRTVSYNAVLMRNPQNGQYLLNYGGVEFNGEYKTITANSVDALLTTMRNGTNKDDFSQLSIDTVRAQAALIPAVHIPASELAQIKQALTQFFLDATRNNFNAVLTLYNRNFLTNGDRGRAIARSLYITAYSFNPVLGDALLR